ncbi:hypothetical protein SAMN04487905_10168 [Actinopolyspora xinjiangensis]|uniref:Uncharacterized protein n=1 Tax=Actinopolyspora xinjiangensis TaxID=405564 RepID=A0A1H0NB07_9ACTN|nr:hypothetical protein [Actinopolyspora xinjiangensis]SDO89892.1 hypothetical protein SAMN04487905_10168 [Actinopolyspora xinjiangensis]
MNGVSMGTWIKVDDGPIRYAVCGDVVEMELGGQGSGAELVTTEEGLSNLLREGTAALHELRRKRHG